MTDFELGWIVALFEGEGCLTFGLQGGPHPSHLGIWRAFIKMTDEDVVRRFHELIGVGTILSLGSEGFRKDGDPYKDAWRWTITRQEDVLNFCALLAPHMGARRAAKLTACIDDLTNISDAKVRA